MRLRQIEAVRRGKHLPWGMTGARGKPGRESKTNAIKTLVRDPARERIGEKDQGCWDWRARIIKDAPLVLKEKSVQCARTRPRRDEETRKSWGHAKCSRKPIKGNYYQRHEGGPPPAATLSNKRTAAQPTGQLSPRKGRKEQASPTQTPRPTSGREFSANWPAFQPEKNSSPKRRARPIIENRFFG